MLYIKYVYTFTIFKTFTMLLAMPIVTTLKAWYYSSFMTHCSTFVP